jgi:23S rRNA (adenine2503-C2)-methyltransferase
MNVVDLNKVLQMYPPYRIVQAHRAVFGSLIESWDEATSLPKDIQEILKKKCPLEIRAQLEQSKDTKTVKALISTGNGDRIESVLMRHRGGRNTICVSSQVGCALACDFCATGKMGLRRNLSTMEIIEQVVLFSRFLKKRGERVSNVVFMGMGEPLLNYDEVMKAVRMMNDKNKLRIGARHISISTVGIVESIKKLTRESLQLNLAVSLNASNDPLRDRLMPVNKKYPIRTVLDSVAGYIRETNRRVMIEYVLLENVNDSKGDALRLAHILKDSLEKLFFVNLISFNPTARYRPSDPKRVRQFKGVLEGEGITVTRRYRFGREIRGACGQLAGCSLRGDI